MKCPRCGWAWFPKNPWCPSEWHAFLAGLSSDELGELDRLLCDARVSR